tara:strand:+ start:21081 stop:21698 length:618 start_codon:yes stop_codon:yes gene_type:complete
LSVVTKNTERVIRQFAERVIKAARLNLGATRTITYNDGKKKRRRQVSSGKLKDSLDYLIDTKQNRNTKGQFQSGFNFSLSFLMEDYGKFIDEGVSGTKYKVPNGSRFGFDTKMPPKGSIRTWMAQKKVRLRDLKTNSFKSLKGMSTEQKEKEYDRAAFLISRSIKQRGIPKSEFFQAPFALEYSKLPQEILEALNNDLDDILANI